MTRITQTVRSGLVFAGLALAMSLAVSHEASAQTGYEDAWTDEITVETDQPDGYFWGYASTDCDSGCMSDPRIFNVSSSTTGSAKDTGSSTFATQTTGGGDHSSVTVLANVSASMPDGDYSFQGDHAVVRSFSEGGFTWDDTALITGIISQIKFAGVQNRYKFSQHIADRWEYVRDDCVASCQTDGEYIHYDAGTEREFLHRSVRKISIFGFGKCVRARLVPHSYRGGCQG